ncbi:MAG: HAD family phosphatase [Deltaproteobacteria bacterium]|nr:HAD family phosphatase [Deltaproteobacteria bacterium]
MLKAVILDCDGVIADTEPVHLRAFQKILDEEGIELLEEDYYREYIGFSDRDCFSAVLSLNDREVDTQGLQDLLQRKAVYYDEYVKDFLRVYPGVKEFVEQAAEKYLLAVVSGALKPEVEFILDKAEIRSHIPVVIAAEDVAKGKPDPEGYLKAFETLKKGSQNGLEARQCVAFEDTAIGIEAVLAAGMRCVGVAHTLSKEILSKATWVVSNMADINIKKLERLYQLGHP